MGADFLFWAITMPHDQKPNWKAGIKFIKEDVEEDSSGRPVTKEDLKKELLAKLDNVKGAWDDKRRDVGCWDLCHLHILITGGMSGCP